MTPDAQARIQDLERELRTLRATVETLIECLDTCAKPPLDHQTCGDLLCMLDDIDADDE